MAVGDESDFDAFGKFYRERRLFRESNFHFKYVNYNRLLKNETPKIASSTIVVFLFFPFEYWNKKIETKRYRGVYGSRTFQIKFKDFWKKVDFSLKRIYPDKNIYFINRPDRAGECRDKTLIKKAFSRMGLLMPKLYNIKSSREICRHLNNGKKLFVKVRFGSMGKGITYLSRDNWQTNFEYRNNRIISRKSDYGWKFRGITGNLSFLKKLLREDVIVEEGVDGLLVKDRIFDLRLYVFLGEVLFIYPRTNNRNNIITNISQDARGESSRFLRYLSKGLVNSAKQSAVKAARAMELNFAGVDILVGNNAKDIYVLEVNAFPGFPRNSIFNLSKHLIRSLSGKEDIVAELSLPMGALNR